MENYNQFIKFSMYKIELLRGHLKFKVALDMVKYGKQINYTKNIFQTVFVVLWVLRMLQFWCFLLLNAFGSCFFSVK